jgi:hypothetical protein
VIGPRAVTFPAELRVLATTSKYVLYAAPGRGYAEYAAIARSEPAPTQAELFVRGLAWLRGGEPARWAFTRFDYRTSAPAEPRAPIDGCATGRISYERVQPARLEVLARCDAASAMVVKVTYHPNWRVTVDGAEASTFMASPSYLSFALPAGEHFIVAEYRSTPVKTPLLVLGGLVLGASVLWGIRRPLQAQWSQLRARGDRHTPR